MFSRLKNWYYREWSDWEFDREIEEYFGGTYRIYVSKSYDGLEKFKKIRVV